MDSVLMDSGFQFVAQAINNSIADSSSLILEDCVLCGGFSHYLNEEGICKNCLESVTEERERQ